MTAHEIQFKKIVALFEQEQDVETGPMMNSPGLKYKDKVFAFFYKDSMVFRLGTNFDPEKW